MYLKIISIDIIILQIKILEKNVSEVNNLLSNINNIDTDNMSEDDWNKVVSFSGSLGWDLPSFFSQTDEQEKRTNSFI